MTTYKLPPKDKNGNVPEGVAKIDGDVVTGIPFDLANTDAQQFAKWLQDGNRPEPAEADGTVTDEWIAETIAKLLP